MRRRPSAISCILFTLLVAAFALNHALFRALAYPVLALLLLRPRAGNLAALCVAAACTNTAAIDNGARFTPWVPTPEADLSALLSLCEVRNRLFVELGSGDGRNLLRAIQAGAARAVGIEYSPFLASVSRLRAWMSASDRGERVSIVCADALSVALPPRGANGTVVYLYMSREFLAPLAVRLACAYGGTRGDDVGGELEHATSSKVAVLSRDFELPPPFGKPRHRLERGRTLLYVYEVPEVAPAVCES